MPLLESKISEQNPVEIPLYTLANAARYLNLPFWVVFSLAGRGPPDPGWFLHHFRRRWPRFATDEGSEFPFPPAEFPRISFRQLTDFFIRSFAVQGIRELARSEKGNEESWFRIHEVVWRGLADPYPAQALSGDAPIEQTIDQIVEWYTRRVPRLSHEWLKKRVLLHMERIEFQNGQPIRLYPFSRDPEMESPRMIVLDPRIRFGRPTVVGRGVPTDILLERFQAGDSSTELAVDYDLSPAEVDEAIRYETLSPVILLNPFFGW